MGLTQVVSSSFQAFNSCSLNRLEFDWISIDGSVPATAPSAVGWSITSNDCNYRHCWRYITKEIMSFTSRPVFKPRESRHFASIIKTWLTCDLWSFEIDQWLIRCWKTTITLRLWTGDEPVHIHPSISSHNIINIILLTCSLRIASRLWVIIKCNFVRVDIVGVALEHRRL